MIVVFNKKKIFVFIIFHQNILGNTWRTHLCVNWHYEKMFVKPIVVSKIIYLEMYLVDLMKIFQVKDAIFMLILQL